MFSSPIGPYRGACGCIVANGDEYSIMTVDNGDDGLERFGYIEVPSSQSSQAN